MASRRRGRTLPFVTKTEAEGVAIIEQRVDANAIIRADEAAHWDRLSASYLTRRISHQESYSDGEACTDQAESFFSRLRRAEIGTHHHIWADTSRPTRRKWRGAKIIGELAMASNS